MEQKTLKVEGMTCDHCVMAVKKAVSGLSGVAKVQVDLDSESVSFELDASVISLKDIEAAIAEAGYSVAA